MARLAAPGKLADPNWYTSLATRMLGDDFTADVVGAYVIAAKYPRDMEVLVARASSRGDSWFRFRLDHLFVLILGIAIGILPLKLWQASLPPRPQTQVLLHVQVVDVPRDVLPSLGMDVTDLKDRAVTLRDSDRSFSTRLKALCRENKAKVLAEPTLVTVMGRPASFSSGGEFPVPVRADDGSTTVEFREFGTRVEFVPTLLSDGRIRLAISPRMSEIDNSRLITVADTQVPGIRSRSGRSFVDLAAGETVVCGTIPGRSADRTADSQTLIVASIEMIAPPVQGATVPSQRGSRLR